MPWHLQDRCLVMKDWPGRRPHQPLPLLCPPRKPVLQLQSTLRPPCVPVPRPLPGGAGSASLVSLFSSPPSPCDEPQEDKSQTTITRVAQRAPLHAEPILPAGAGRRAARAPEAHDAGLFSRSLLRSKDFNKNKTLARLSPGSGGIDLTSQPLEPLCSENHCCARRQLRLLESTGRPARFD